MYIPSLSSSWLNIIHFSFSIISSLPSTFSLSFRFTTLTIFSSTLFYPLALSFSLFLFFRGTITISPFPLFILHRYVSLLSIFLSLSSHITFLHPRVPFFTLFGCSLNTRESAKSSFVQQAIVEATFSPACRPWFPSLLLASL